ncbi:MAG: hypothetical protein SNJ68_11840 [Cyanobacteriota bacterium]
MLMLSSVLVLLCGCSGGGGSSLVNLPGLPGVVQLTIVASASPTPGSTASPGSANHPTGSPTDEEGSGSGNPGSDPTAGLLPEDELDRLFPNLPPDPGEEGKRTLEGIDADGDGVRDDVQRWIYRRYPNEELKRKAMLRYAKTLQASIVNVNRDSRDQVRARVLDGFRAERCARLAFGGVDEFDLIDEVAEVVREVQLQMLNTRERVIADLTVDIKFSGQVVGADESSCTDPIR